MAIEPVLIVDDPEPKEMELSAFAVAPAPKADAWEELAFADVPTAVAFIPKV